MSAVSSLTVLDDDNQIATRAHRHEASSWTLHKTRSQESQHTRVQLLLITFICNRRNVEHLNRCISAISQPLQASLSRFSSQQLDS